MKKSELKKQELPAGVEQQRCLVENQGNPNNSLCKCCKSVVVGTVCLLIFLGFLSISFSYLRKWNSTSDRLQCYQCEYSQNLPHNRSRYTKENYCGSKPVHTTYCDAEQYCGSRYQVVNHPSGEVTKLVERFCHKRHRPGCHSSNNHGVYEISCLCNQNLCIQMLHDD